MSPNWIISVGGRTFGPYTAAQMQIFAAEGRLAPHSLIARTEDGRFGPASQDPLLLPFFQAVQSASQAEPEPAPAGEGPRSFGQSEAAATDEPAHFLIVADMKSGSITALEEEIFRLGPAYAVMPQAWVLSSELTVSALRNHLIQKLGKLDLLFIADATRDKVTWFNLGMEAETRVRRIWTKYPQSSAA
jgi:hypothetical protein